MTFTRTEMLFSSFLGALDRATGFAKDGGPQTAARVFGHRKSVAQSVSRYLPDQSFGLDVGAGDGSLSRHFNDLEHKLLPLDPYLQSGIRGVAARGEKLPFSDGTFAFVTAVYALHHCDNPDLVLDEICRILTPNGILGVLEEHPRYRGQEFIMQANEYRTNSILHGKARSGKYLASRSHFYEQEDLKSKLQTCGMKLVEEVEYPSLSRIRTLYKSRKILGIYRKL